MYSYKKRYNSFRSAICMVCRQSQTVNIFYFIDRYLFFIKSSLMYSWNDNNSKKLLKVSIAVLTTSRKSENVTLKFPNLLFDKETL